MYTFLVLEPSLLSGTRFVADSRYSADIERILRSARYNGCLIVDTDGDLLRRMLAEMRTIPPKYRQRVFILFDELYQGLRGKKRVVSFPVDRVTHHDLGTTRIVAALLLACGADAVIAPSSCHAAIRNEGVPQTSVVDVSAYEESAAEQARLSYLQPRALDNLPMQEVEELFSRVFRFARWLRVYDKQIGKGGNIGGFRAGIDYVLTQWLRSSRVTLAGATLEIITAVKESPRPDDPEGRQSELRTENARALEVVERAIIYPLRRKHSFEISLQAREDPRREWHARFYETNLGVLKVDPGADILSRSGRFKRVYLDHAEQHAEDLTAIYSLPRFLRRSYGNWVVDNSPR